MLRVRFLLPHPFYCEVVLCTILKGRSLKSCVALVVFCCSLLLACISPAWAGTHIYGSPDYDDAHGMTLYACVYGPDDPIRMGQSFSLPIFDMQGFAAVSPRSSGAWGYAFQSLEFQPFDYDVSLVLGFTVIPPADGSVEGTLNYSQYDRVIGTTDYFRNGITGDSSMNYSLSWSWLNNGYISSPTPAATIAPYGVVSYRVPAGTNGVRGDVLAWSDLIVYDKAALMACVAGYIVHSTEQSVVEQVNSILEEVKKVNGNLTSALSVLNQILISCQGIEADTATIVTILGLCKDQLISLNGKVDDIYKLLKDSLATESAAVDKKSEVLAGQIMQRVDSEQYWSDKNTETFNALDMGNFTFGDGVVGALPTVGNLFKSLWASLGDVTLIFTFPLMLGLALVIVGRIARTSGKGSKKGGDDG